MAYRKVYIAIDCNNDAEALAAQAFAKEFSQMFQLRATDVLKIAPIVRKNGGLLMKTIRTISEEGSKGIAKMIPYFLANVKK